MFSRSTTTIGFACTIFYACSILLVVAGNGGLAFKIPDSSSRRPKVTRTFALARENLPPPTSPEGNPNDDVFRGIRSSWPIPLQNWLTENGLTRTVQDSLIYLGLPALVQEYPAALWDFFHLSTSCTFDFAKKEENADGSTIYARRSRIKSRIDQLQYGQHKSQFMDLIEPYPSTATSKSNKKPNGVAVFVHGGAWGSGQPWMYRLVSLPFLEQNMAVAIVGYRTYPDTNVDGQVADVGSAIEYLATERPDLMNDKGEISALVGHSSGAHISLLYALESARNALQGMTSTPIQKLLMLSGVYCIPSHYEYEKGRGVDQISAMRVACSPFIEASPAYRLKCIVRSDGSEECKLLDAGGSRLTLDDHVLPDLLFIHGVDDNVVQYTQSCEMVDSIRSTLKTPERCRELILEGVGHVDTALHLMVGGVTKDIIKVEIMGDDGGNK